MENSTKIYIGVGAAALVAFLLLRNKAAAQKPADKKDDCPAGQIRIQPRCIKAPCNSYCQPIEDFSNDEDMTYDKPKPKQECPAGTIQEVMPCIYPPCPSFCMPIK